jgi:hypothetical protein
MSMEMTDPIFILGGAVMTTLCGAVGYLFSDFRATKIKVELELKECQDDRLKLWKEIHLIKGKTE